MLIAIFGLLGLTTASAQCTHSKATSQKAKCTKKAEKTASAAKKGKAIKASLNEAPTKTVKAKSKKDCSKKCSKIVQKLTFQ